MFSIWRKDNKTVVIDDAPIGAVSGSSAMVRIVCKEGPLGKERHDVIVPAQLAGFAEAMLWAMGYRKVEG